MGTKTNLDNAKVKADDEFYTSFCDIATELNKWKNKFSNKDIICPCDWDILDDRVESITIKFKPTRFYINSVYKKRNTIEFNLFDDFKIEEEYKEISEAVFRKLLEKRATCNFLQYLWTIGEECNIKSITASGYNTTKKLGVSFDEVDYSKYNLCITNPPFSLYSKFMDNLMVEKNIREDFDFALIMPTINRIAPCIAIPLMERKAYLGYGRHLAMEFRNGLAIKKVGVDWLVSWKDAQDLLDSKDNLSVIKYNEHKDEYPIIETMTLKDGTHPIKIKSITAIPTDYNGWMFITSSVLDHLNYKKYEWICTSCKKYFNKTHPEKNPFVHAVSNEMIGYGTENSSFHGILFKKI